MNTIRKQPSAKEYERNFRLTKNVDMFLYSNTTSRRIESSSSSYGGGRTEVVLTRVAAEVATVEEEEGFKNKLYIKKGGNIL